jgi:anti-sigma regulatory factor (Ser/Thr protein kinase)
MQHNTADTDAQAVIAEAHGVWAADPIHLPHIRALIRGWLAPLTLDSDTEQDLVLAVNEAVSNAIEHAYVASGPDDLVKVSFWTDPQHLYFEVADDGRWKEAVTNGGHRGRGILIMQQMVGAVSIDHDVNGTRVLLRHPTSW